MIESHSPLTRALAVTLASAVALSTAVALRPVLAAEREKPKTRRVQVVRPKYYKKFQEIHELLSQGQHQQVIEKLDDIKDDSLNNRETALMWQAYGFTYAAQERYDEAVAAWEKCVATQGLHESQELNIRYNIAQLYMIQERYREAIRSLEAWFNAADNPQPDAYILMAQAYVQLDDYDSALTWAERGVAKAAKPKEPWLQLLTALYFDKKRYQDVARVLGILVEHYPKKQYWMQLSAAYGELGEERKALAVLEVAYIQKLLDRSNEFERLAQLYAYHEVPYKCARVLSDGLESGAVESDTDNWKLLADCWVTAREYERAVAPLTKAATLADNGDLFVRLGQVYFESESWAKARDALEKAFTKGSLRDTCQAQFLYGIANYNTGRIQSAQRAFQRSRRCDRWEKASATWLKHITSESAE